VTPEQVEEAISGKTKLLILNSPSNPTGAVYSREEMEAIMEVVLRHKLYLMSDEIYEYLYYDGLSHSSPASFSKEAAARTITVGGFSKTFSMTGWRLGTLHAPAEIAKAIGSIQSQTSSNATTFAQWGALAALEKPDLAQAALDEMLVAFDRRRLTLFEGLNGIEGVSSLRAQGAFYLFPNISSFGLSSNEFSARLLEEAKVAVVPGSGFGADDYIRLSYATSDAIIEKGLERLKAFCAGF
jgi:aspartate aminotransferase